MTHEDLRVAAVRYAKMMKYENYTRVGFGCGVIASECVTAASDIPDVIGWRSGTSYLVECKASRADFLRDANKPQRKTGTGMGVYRYYFAPSGLLAKADIPAEWGLIEFDGRKSNLVEECERRELDAKGHEEEKRILLSLVRRVRKREFLIIQMEPSDEPATTPLISEPDSEAIKTAPNGPKHR